MKRKTGSSTQRPSDPKLSEAARHVVIPKGLVTTAWPRVESFWKPAGILFDAWQQGVGQVALGKRKDGKYAATVGGIVLSIPRQVGKTFLIGMIIVALCVLYPGMTVLWTAHRTRTTTKTFGTLKGIALRKHVRRFLKPGRNDGIRSANGEQEIRFQNGSVIMFGAREQGFGRGFDAVDVAVFDEAQILTEKALEDMVPAANQAKADGGALLFFMGTPPRPSDPGEEFSNRRSRALDGRSKNTVYVEFSADEDADPDDRVQWEKANPSYPLRTPLESMQRMREQLTDDDSFMREALGVWDPVLTSQVIPQDSWDRVADTSSVPLEKLTLAIDVAPDRSTASVALAGLRADGRWHVELDDHRKGVDWVIPWVKARADKNRLHAVVVDEITGLTEEKRGRHFLTDTRVLVTLAAAEGRDMAIASAKFFDAVVDESLRHTDQPQMNVALSVASKRPLAGGWAWNRKNSDSDITPVVAATLALWGAQSVNVKRPTAAREGRKAVVL